MPKVSVCIPVYNCGKFIGKTIESVLAQSFTDFELLIFDNKSTDNTIAEIKKFKDKRIKLIKNARNIGVEKNWNLCLEKPKGEYIKLLPADDILYKDCLKTQVRILDEHSSAVMVNAARDMINEDGKKIMTRRYGGANGFINGYKAINKCVSLGRNFIGEPGAVLFRSQVSKKTGIFDGSIGYIIDLDYWFRLLVQGDLFVINDVHCTFRISANSWTVNILNSQKSDLHAFFDRTYQKQIFKISKFSMLSGKFFASVNAFLRSIAIKYFFK